MCLVVLHVSLDITTNTGRTRHGYRLHALVASKRISPENSDVMNLRHGCFGISAGNFWRSLFVRLLAGPALE